MKWSKGQHIFDPTGRSDWMDSYAQNPNAIVMEDRLRIYFTCRPKPDEKGAFVSYIGYADFEKNDPFQLIEIAQEPVMPLGSVGDFDEFGTMPGSILFIEEKNEFWLYYVGWARMASVPYKWSNGIAISKDGGKTFQKPFKGPILPATFFDPYLQACPRVYRLGNNEWVMFYQSGTEWNKVNNKYESVYITRRAKSKDGIHWNTFEDQVIPSKVEKECQTSAAFFYHNNMYHMYFSYRYGIGFRTKERGYRIGYMFSVDGINWNRNDELGGLKVSKTGWDSEMICYPNVFHLNDNIYILYCGNYFGKYGFGISKLVV
jgi:hypothetical protein